MNAKKELERLNNVKRKLEIIDEIFSDWNIEECSNRFSLSYYFNKFTLIYKICFRYNELKEYKLDEEDLEVLVEHFKQKRRRLKIALGMITCIQCKKHNTLDCPNSESCLATEKKPYFELKN